MANSEGALLPTRYLTLPMPEYRRPGGKAATDDLSGPASETFNRKYQGRSAVGRLESFPTLPAIAKLAMPWTLTGTLLTAPASGRDSTHASQLACPMRQNVGLQEYDQSSNASGTESGSVSKVPTFWRRPCPILPMAAFRRELRHSVFGAIRYGPPGLCARIPSYPRDSSHTLRVPHDSANVIKVPVAPADREHDSSRTGG